MGEIRIVGPGETRGYPYPVCKKMTVIRHIKVQMLVILMRVTVLLSR